MPKVTDYYGLPKAVMDSARCTECDLCRESCRFDAISTEGGYKIDPFSCEGCGVCEYICPAGAITMEPAVAGKLMLYSDTTKVFSTAQLKMGSGTSGLLVTEVKRQMKAAAKDAELAIIDGSPGIGCPVIASLSGVDMVLIVAEPSVSGISDMERVINTAERFRTKIVVCINKYDTNIEHTEKIEKLCEERGLPVLGRISFDSEAVKAINKGRSIVELDCASGRAVRAVYEKAMEVLFT